MHNINFKKIDIIEEISKKTGFPQNFSKKILNDLIDIIINELKHSNINIKNLGTFKVIFKNKRLGRNPMTNEKHVITARNSISFTPSQEILEYLNKTI